MNKRISILVISVLIVAMVSIFTIARANTTPFVEPPAKQTFEAVQTQLQATAETGPHAPKSDLSLPTATKPASCPFPGPGATYVATPGPDTGAPPFDAREFIITTKAIAAFGGNYYTIWVGAPTNEPNQGLIRVLVDSADPCASHRLGTTTPSTMTDYTTSKGPLTATKVEGNILFFSTEGGGTGQFNFVTGQFLP